jgi:O-antigen/teichoic acid export membrane protein
MSAKVFRNMAVVFGAEVLSKVFEFLFVIYCANRLGVAGFGMLSSALAFTGLFSFLTDMGLYQLTVRELARDKGKARDYLAGVAGLKAALSAAVYAAMAAMAYASGYGGEQATLILVLGISMVLESFNYLFNSVFQAHERLEYSALGRVLATVSLLAGGLASVHFGWDVMGFAAAYVMARGLNAAYGLACVRRFFFTPSISFWPGAWRGLLSESWPYGLTSVITNVFLSLDIVLVGAILGRSEAGIYAAASKMVLGLGFILAAYNQSVYPALSGLSGRRPEFNRVSGFFLKSMLFIGVPMCAITFVRPEGIIGLLYSSEYGRAASVLPALVFAMFLGFLSSPFHRALDASGRQRTVFFAILIGTALSAAINVTMLGRAGILAAAYSAIIAQSVFLLVPAVACARWGLMPTIGIRYGAALLCASAVMIVAIQATAGLPTPHAMALSLATYCAAYALSGGLREIVQIR